MAARRHAAFRDIVDTRTGNAPEQINRQKLSRTGTRLALCAPLKAQRDRRPLVEAARRRDAFLGNTPAFSLCLTESRRFSSFLRLCDNRWCGTNVRFVHHHPLRSTYRNLMSSGTGASIVRGERPRIWRAWEPIRRCNVIADRFCSAGGRFWPVAEMTTAGRGVRSSGSTCRQGDLAEPTRVAPHLAGVRNRSKFRRHAPEARRLKVTRRRHRSASADAAGRHVLIKRVQKRWSDESSIRRVGRPPARQAR